MSNKALLIVSAEYWKLAADVLDAFSDTPGVLQCSLAEARHPGYVAVVPTTVGCVQFHGKIEIPTAAVLLIVSEDSDTVGFHAILQAVTKTQPTA